MNITMGHFDCLTLKENLDIARRFASRVAGGRLSHDDLEEAAIWACFEAARRYDPSKGARFTTFLFWWVQKAVLEAVDAAGPLYVPVDARKLRRRVLKLAALGTPLVEIAAKERLETGEVLALLGSRESAELPVEAALEPLEAPLEPSPDAREALAAALATMPPRVAEALLWLYGVEREQLTVEETAEKLGVSRRTVYNWLARYAPFWNAEVCREAA